MTNEIVRVARLELRFEPRAWAFADERRADIDAYFARLRAAKPALYNGRVLLMHRWDLQDGVLRGGYLETDFASYIAWRDEGHPPPPMWNCFAQGALRGTDGGFLLGEMGQHTANAGKIYFPSGTPDPDDIAGDAVDLNASLAREIEEETGLTPADYQPEPEWACIFSGARIALIKIMQLREPAEAVRERIRRNLAAQTEPELSDMVIARGPADIGARMPDFIQAYLANLWRL